MLFCSSMLFSFLPLPACISVTSSYTGSQLGWLNESSHLRRRWNRPPTTHSRATQTMVRTANTNREEEMAAAAIVTVSMVRVGATLGLVVTGSVMLESPSKMRKMKYQIVHKHALLLIMSG